MPKVSVIIPCYNHAEQLPGAIASVLGSKGIAIKNIEIIVIDDHSKDGAAIKLIAETSSVTLVRHEQNKGVAAARNTGVALAKADYVLMLDADNRLKPWALKVLLAEIGSASAAYGMLQKVQDGKPVGMLSQAHWDPERLTRGPYIDALALFKKQALIELGGHNEQLKEIKQGWEDYFLWLQLASINASVCFTPQIVAEYQVLEGSMISQGKEKEKDLAQYFRSAFPDLLRRYPGNIAFGYPATP